MGSREKSETTAPTRPLFLPPVTWTVSLITKLTASVLVPALNLSVTSLEIATQRRPTTIRKTLLLSLTLDKRGNAILCMLRNRFYSRGLRGAGILSRVENESGVSDRRFLRVPLPADPRRAAAAEVHDQPHDTKRTPHRARVMGFEPSRRATRSRCRSVGAASARPGSRRRRAARLRPGAARPRPRNTWLRSQPRTAQWPAGPPSASRHA